MKLSHFVPVIALAAALSACKTVDTPDGKIPAQYLSLAKTLEGTYHGKFERMDSDITLTIEGDTPVLTYTNAWGHDLLGQGCGSSIGKLKSVSVSGPDANLSIDNASFEFNPGKCLALGKTVDVSIRNQVDGTKLDVSVLKDSHQVYIPGHYYCNPGEPCYTDPGHYDTIFNYYSGSFKKQN
jgi:hypothetical protein